MVRKSSKKLDSLAEQIQNKGTPVLETGHEVWLAGLGALSVARKKGEKVAGKGAKMFDRLVAEGQKLEKKVGKTVRSDAREVTKQVSGAADKAKEQAKRTADKAKSQVKKTVDKAKGLTRKTANQAKSQVKNTVDTAKGQTKKTAVKAKGQAKKATSKVMPKPTGPVTLHLVPKDGEWTVRREGSDEDLSLHSTKQSAVKAARGIARAHAPSHLVVHRSDGTVQESFSYS